MDLSPLAFADPDADVSVTYRSGRWLHGARRFPRRVGAGRRARAGFTSPRTRTRSTPFCASCIRWCWPGRADFLLHSASAIRNGKAFLFAGVSGAGKTTISRLAPADATLLTDEISYVRKLNSEDGYVAFGTPFTGELAKLGENASAPVAALYLLAQGPENRIEPVAAADAGRELLANMLFFAEDQEMVHWAFQAACDFVHRVPVYRLTFVPDARVWEMIG